MTDQHPITPPPELVRQIQDAALFDGDDGQGYEMRLIMAAYRAGADQELEACCEWVEKTIPSWAPHTLSEQLRLARRPKPPSLQTQALNDLEEIAATLMKNNFPCNTGSIRRALEQLND